MRKILSDGGFEFFARYDTSVGVYEIFLSDTGEDYFGCADTIHDALELAREWLADQEI